MGIINLPPQKRICSKCQSESFKEFDEPAKDYKKTGHDHVIRCNKCGHESRNYIPSLMEQEMGGSGGSWSYNPNKPQPF